jgi:hypothetical protein
MGMLGLCGTVTTSCSQTRLVLVMQALAGLVTLHYTYLKMRQ